MSDSLTRKVGVPGSIVEDSQERGPLDFAPLSLTVFSLGLTAVCEQALAPSPEPCGEGR